MEPLLLDDPPQAESIIAAVNKIMPNRSIALSLLFSI
jgi:hypothetical protein